MSSISPLAWKRPGRVTPWPCGRTARALLLPLLPVDLDLLISDVASAAHWAGSRWHVLGHIHREGVPLHAS